MKKVILLLSLSTALCKATEEATYHYPYGAAALARACFEGNIESIRALVDKGVLHTLPEENTTKSGDFLEEDLLRGCARAGALGSLARGYNVVGLCLMPDGSCACDPVLDEVLRTLGCTTVSMSELKHEGATISLDIVRNAEATRTLEDTYWVSNDLIEVCFKGDAAAVEGILASNPELQNQLVTQFTSVKGYLVDSTSLIDCLEAAMHGTLCRGYNILGRSLNAQNTQGLDENFHEVLKTLRAHGVDVNGMLFCCPILN